ncbi:DUF484 family protein [Collimonas sp. OK412]|jgi:uncharacterized protein YigA (DUF484 family)|uniref:DUF484 family protein n=1 Tax=Collimonas sp. (strain OK412) TaxID=1801619 RepID=UPI0008E9B80F|nr:DUF484 family protein [Collimonas sp. OK412]SFC15340.1 hypothetical protein SAMN04515619_10531 [Collimonas sp. OK412]
MSFQPDPDTVAQYLIDSPHFFEEHAELLAKIRLSSPLLGRAVSLQERQMEVLREKIKVQDLRLADMMRNAQENDTSSHKLHAWTRSLLLARNDVDLPHTLVDGLRTGFAVPQATLRLWGVAEDYSHTWFAAEASEDAKIFANGLNLPFCGSNNDFEAASWLEQDIQSVAMLPLRSSTATPATFGLLVLGSPDPQRFSADMATDFLVQIGETASAALACLLE